MSSYERDMIALQTPSPPSPPPSLPTHLNKPFNPLLSSPALPTETRDPTSLADTSAETGSENFEGEDEPERFVSDWGESDKALSPEANTDVDEMEVDCQLDSGRKDTESDDGRRAGTDGDEESIKKPVAEQNLSGIPPSPKTSPATSPPNSPSHILHRTLPNNTIASPPHLPPLIAREPVILVPNSDPQSSATSSNARSQHTTEPVTVAAVDGPDDGIPNPDSQQVSQFPPSSLARLTPISSSPPPSSLALIQSQAPVIAFSSTSETAPPPSNPRPPRILVPSSESQSSGGNASNQSQATNGTQDSVASQSIERQLGLAFARLIKEPDSSPIFPPSVERPAPGDRLATGAYSPLAGKTHQDTVSHPPSDGEDVVEDFGASKDVRSCGVQSDKPPVQPLARIRKATDDLEAPPSKRPNIFPMKPLIPRPRSPGYAPLKAQNRGPLQTSLSEKGAQPPKPAAALSSDTSTLRDIPLLKPAKSLPNVSDGRALGTITSKKPSFNGATSGPSRPKPPPTIIDLTGSDSEPEDRTSTSVRSGPHHGRSVKELPAADKRPVTSDKVKSDRASSVRRKGKESPVAPSKGDIGAIRRESLLPYPSASRSAGRTPVGVVSTASPHLDFIKKKLGLESATISRPPALPKAAKDTAVSGPKVVDHTSVQHIPHLDLKAMAKKSASARKSLAKRPAVPEDVFGGEGLSGQAPIPTSEKGKGRVVIQGDTMPSRDAAPSYVANPAEQAPRHVPRRKKAGVAGPSISMSEPTLAEGQDEMAVDECPPLKGSKRQPKLGGFRPRVGHNLRDERPHVAYITMLDLLHVGSTIKQHRESNAAT